MYQIHKTYIRPEMKLAKLINENPQLLLVLEHFGIDFLVNDHTVQQICADNKISSNIFIIFANLYNGFNPDGKNIVTTDDIPSIIRFLKNTHDYYKNDKYPEIKYLISKLYDNNKKEDIKLIEKFFNEYFNEVLEHLDYEDRIVFPYFCRLINDENNQNSEDISVDDYRTHHTDIETKLADLKNLLLKYISLNNNLSTRRKLILNLFELEFDLDIHSKIEEMILQPLVYEIEKNKNNG